MLNIRVMLAAAMLTAPAVWALGSIVSEPAQQVSLATPDQVDAYALMSRAAELPTERYQAF